MRSEAETRFGCPWKSRCWGRGRAELKCWRSTMHWHRWPSDPRKVRVVELRFFGGLSVEETAEFLGISPETVLRDWKMAKVWLLRELSRHSTTSADLP